MPTLGDNKNKSEVQLHTRGEGFESGGLDVSIGTVGHFFREMTYFDGSQSSRCGAGVHSHDVYGRRSSKEAGYLKLQKRERVVRFNDQQLSTINKDWWRTAGL